MNLYHLPGAAKNAKAISSLESKAFTGAGAATQHLPQVKSDLRVSATRNVPAIPTINVETRGE